MRYVRQVLRTMSSEWSASTEIRSAAQPASATAGTRVSDQNAGLRGLMRPTKAATNKKADPPATSAPARTAPSGLSRRPRRQEGATHPGGLAPNNRPHAHRTANAYGTRHTPQISVGARRSPQPGTAAAMASATSVAAKT